MNFMSQNYTKMCNRNFRGAGKFNGIAPSRSYNSALGALLCMKLTGDTEQNFGKTKQVLFGDHVGFILV